MKHSSKELKGRAREALMGRYPVFIVASALYIIFYAMTPTLTLALAPKGEPLTSWIFQMVLSFLISLVISLLTVGLYRIALCVSRGNTPSIGMLFSGFTTQPDHIIASQLILQCLRVILSLPGYYYSYQLTLYPDNQTYYLMFLALSSVSSLLFGLITLGFSMNLFILADEPETGGTEALRMSWEMMKGYKCRYLYLALSFTGIILLVLFSFFIGILFFIPYFSVTFANFYRNAKHEI